MLELEAKRQATNFSDFDVKTNAQQMAPVCRILILQQIKLEKNGFHGLKERQISFHTMQNYYLNTYFLSKLKAKGQ